MRSSRSFAWFPYAILSISVLFTVLGTAFLSKGVADRERDRFEHAALIVQEKIQERIEKYTLALIGARGLFDASGEMTRERFYAYTDSLNLRARYPGIQGLGFTVRFPAERVEELVETVRRETENPAYDVDRRAPRDEYHALLYLAPLDERNRLALGYDISTEPVRREALERGRDTGNAAASGIITLIQEAKDAPEPGFVIYLPYYQTRNVPEELADKRRFLRGYLSAPFRARDFFQGIFRHDERTGVDFDVYDGDGSVEKTRLFSSAARDRTKKPRMESYYRIDAAGRAWTLHAVPNGSGSGMREVLPLVFGAGLLASAALFFLSTSLVRANDSLKKTSKTLAASEARKTAILESSLDCIISMDHDGRVVEWNKAAERVFGHSSSDAIGKEMATLIIPSKYQEAHRKGLASYLATGVGPVLNRRIEIEGLRADGTTFPVELTITRIGSENPPVFTGFLRDITERKLKERDASFLAELTLSTQRIESPDQIMSVTARLLGEHLGADRCAYAEVENESVFVITGDHVRGVPSIVGRWPVAGFGQECERRMHAKQVFVVSDADADPAVGPGDLAAYRATTIRSVICVPLHKEGRFTAAMAVHQKTPRVWASAEIELVQVVVSRCWESLERAKAARDVRESAQDLKRSNQRLEQFAYVASHDLQEPLRKIVTFGERLQERMKEAADKDYLTRIQGAALRLKSVVEDLLQYSRLSKPETLEKETVNLRFLMADVLSDLEIKIAESDATIRVIDECPLKGNATQLRHLLQNLLTNSLKFSKKGVKPQISVSSVVKEGRCELRVTDNGIGFDPKYAEKIFMPFQRLHGRSEYEGTGIGLAIVQTIVQSHGGSISAESRPGEGASFLIRLPS